MRPDRVAGYPANPREEFVGPVPRRLGDAAEKIGGPVLRIDVAEAGGTDQRAYRRRARLCFVP